MAVLMRADYVRAPDLEGAWGRRIKGVDAKKRPGENRVFEFAFQPKTKNQFEPLVASESPNTPPKMLEAGRSGACCAVGAVCWPDSGSCK